jgi:hypothetical protein
METDGAETTKDHTLDAPFAALRRIIDGTIGAVILLSEKEPAFMTLTFGLSLVGRRDAIHCGVRFQSAIVAPLGGTAALVERLDSVIPPETREATPGNGAFQRLLSEAFMELNDARTRAVEALRRLDDAIENSLRSSAEKRTALWDAAGAMAAPLGARIAPFHARPDIVEFDARRRLSAHERMRLVAAVEKSPINELVAAILEKDRVP